MSKVILTHEVEGLGVAGDVVVVKDGYARNYLLPQGFAVTWTAGGDKQIEQIRAARLARANRTLDEAKEAKAKLEAAKISIAAKTGKEGRLFGSIKPNDLVEAVAAAGIGEIDKRSIVFPNGIKSVGVYEANVRLHDEIVANLAFQVIAKK